MNKVIEIKSTSVELAIEEGLLELDAKIEDVEVEVLSKGGLFQKAVIKMTRIESMAKVAEEFVNGVIKHMRIDAEACAKETEKSIIVNVTGKDSSAIIGYRGEVLDAIQYLTLTVLNHGDKHRYKKVVIDAENYRERREETLVGLANNLAEKAYATCKKVVLEPMNPYERRIIHATLHDSETVQTTSEGEEPNRHVVIIPQGVEIVGTYETRRDNNRQGRSNPQRRRDGRSGDRRSNYDRAPSYDRAKSYDRAPRENRERAPMDSYDAYDNLESTPQKMPEFNDFDPVKKEGAPRFKSFGKKKFPF